MSKYHINPVTGSASLCAASKGKCPFGGIDKHYESLEEARANFEEYMADHTFPEMTPKELQREFRIAEAEREVLRDGRVEDPTVTAQRLLSEASIIENLKAEVWVTPATSEPFMTLREKIEVARNVEEKMKKELLVRNDAYTKSLKASLTGRVAPEVNAAYEKAEELLAEAKERLKILENERQELRQEKKKEIENYSSFMAKKESWDHYPPSERSIFTNAGKALKEICASIDWEDSKSIDDAVAMIDALGDRLQEQGYDAIGRNEDPSPYWAAEEGVAHLLEGFYELQ